MIRGGCAMHLPRNFISFIHNIEFHMMNTEGKNCLTGISVDTRYTGPVWVFDLDDTLAEERDFLFSGFRAVHKLLIPLVGVEIAARAESEMRRAATEHANHYSALESLLDSTGLRDKVDIKLVVDTCRNHVPDEGYRLRTDAGFLLRALQRHRIVCCLITDGRSRTQRNKIRALGLDKFIREQDILISGETGYDKYHQEPFRSVMHRYPYARSFTYIGDNPAKDFLHPRNSGWHTIMLRDRGYNISHQHFIWDRNAMPDMVSDELIQIFWKNVIKH